jgi:hypothetical protein
MKRVFRIVAAVSLFPGWLGFWLLRPEAGRQRITGFVAIAACLASPLSPDPRVHVALMAVYGLLSTVVVVNGWRAYLRARELKNWSI